MLINLTVSLCLIIANTNTIPTSVHTAFAIQSDSLFVTKKTDKAASIVVKELKQKIERKGLKIFGEIQHHAEAEKVGEQLRFTEVIIFGNPKVGTKLMQCDQRIGYELPLRILINTSSEGKTIISFQDPRNYNKEYHMEGCNNILEKMSSLLNELVSDVL
jgi:uncharacterized protein (DUF302 family)